MGLWCGHAVLPFPSFDLVFLFHLLGQVALALVTFFALSLLLLLFLFLFFFSSLSPGSVWSWCVSTFSEASFLCFCSDLLSSFPQDFLLPPGSGVLRRSCLLFFFFVVFLSAFEISFSSRPFLFFLEGRSGLGLLSSVLRWVLWTLLLALGRFVLLSLPGPLAVQLRFFFLSLSLHVVQTEPWSFFIAKKSLVLCRLF